MIKKIKNISLISIALYLLAVIVLFIWVVPVAMNYYSNINSYEKNIKKMKTIYSEYNIESNPKIFTANLFKKDAELIFSKVDVTSIDQDKYSINIEIKKEDIESLHTFIKTLSLRYLIKIDNTLEFTAHDKVITIKLIIVKL